MNEITYKYNPDYGGIEISVDGVEIVCWSCDGTPDESVADFTKIFNLRSSIEAKRIDALEAAMKKAIELLTKGYDSVGIIAHGLSTALEDTA